MKIDRRRHYVMVLDTETANTLTDENGNLDMSNVLVYDCGWAVVDTKGNLYETASYVNRDIFYNEKDLMQSAYYAKKIPLYIADLEKGTRTLANTYQIRKAMLDTIQRFGIKQVVAHNARFDYNALNILQRWATASKFRYWFPFESVEIWDTMRMAQDVLFKMPTYIKFCEKHGFMVREGLPRKTAEVIYRYITDNPYFVESHTGLEDVLIECKIMWYCFRQHKPMRKSCFPDRPSWPAATQFQKDLLTSIKKQPIL